VEEGFFHDSKPWNASSPSGSQVSFGKSDVLATLKDIRNSEDPSTLLKSLCSSYDILDLADSEDDVFQQGMRYLLEAARTAPPDAHPHFLETFALIAGAIEGNCKQMQLQIALDSLMHSDFQPFAIDLSSMVLSQISELTPLHTMIVYRVYRLSRPSRTKHAIKFCTYSSGNVPVRGPNVLGQWRAAGVLG
jgi:hypothetical protein